MSGMTPWEARDLLLRRDPERARRVQAVDPLPPPPKPCTCARADMIEVSVIERRKVLLICGGRC